MKSQSSVFELPGRLPVRIIERGDDGQWH